MSMIGLEIECVHETMLLPAEAEASPDIPSIPSHSFGDTVAMETHMVPSWSVALESMGG